MGRKDRERFQRLRETDPSYVGYRGLGYSTARPPSLDTETAICSLCQRKRNVAVENLPHDLSRFVCLTCQENTAVSL